LIALTQDSKESKSRKNQQQAPYNRSDFLYPTPAAAMDETMPKEGIIGIKNTVVDAFKH
jgi:hypothetical protein